MPTTSSHVQSHAELWRLLNRSQKPEPDTMRVGCTALFLMYALIIVLRMHEGVALTVLRFGMLSYAGLGIRYASRATWSQQRAYAFGLAVVLPLQAAAIGAIQGNHIGDVLFTALAIFVSLIFLQTARDLLIVDAWLVLGNTVVVWCAPSPAVPILTIVVTLGSVLVTASVVALRTLLYRARWSESLGRVEAALGERAEWQRRYEEATAASGQVLYDWEPSTNRVSYGGAVESMLGYSASALDGPLERWMALVHPDDAADAHAVLARESSFQLRYRLRRKDGATIVVEDHGHFVFDEVGEVVRVVGFISDVTERTKAEAARDEEAATAAALARIGRELISSLETPVLMDRLCRVTTEVLTADFSQTWIRDSADGMFALHASYGLGTEEVEHLRLLRLPADPTTGLFARLLCDDVELATPTTTAYPRVSTLLAYYALGPALFLALRRGDEIVGVHLVGWRAEDASVGERQWRIARGIAQLASMALTNVQLVEELERASNLKSEFVSTMSHELRTPLNVILGYTDMLADEPLAPSQRLLVARVRRSSVELLEMIEATLDLSRITAGKDTPTFEPLAVAELWSELETEFAALPRDAAVALRFEPAGSAVLQTDRRKLKMIVKNLVGNALKFTPAGHVVATCAAGGDEVVFAVRDTGIGIPADHLSSIFEMFRQVDSSDARSYSGAGLGLYIVRQLVTQLGGTVGVESEPGRGSTFRVVLPAAPRGERRQIAA